MGGTCIDSSPFTSHPRLLGPSSIPIVAQCGIHRRAEAANQPVGQWRGGNLILDQPSILNCTVLISGTAKLMLARTKLKKWSIICRHPVSVIIKHIQRWKRKRDDNKSIEEV